jgi:glycerophosphoryl diester phosphodiesterase
MTVDLSTLDWLVARPIAHRGLHDAKAGRVENTSSAFAGALAGNYAIECDLQLTRDAEAAVFHDEKLDRLLNASGWVKDHTIQQVKAMSFKAGTDRVQTLQELLDQVAGRVTLVIELKSHFDGDIRLVERALSVLKNYRGRYAVMSFDPVLVQALAALSPDTVRGITADKATDPEYDALPLHTRTSMGKMDHLERTRPHFVSYYFRDLPYPLVADLRSEGHPVITWTIRNRQEELMARQYSDQVTFEGFEA